MNFLIVEPSPLPILIPLGLKYSPDWGTILELIFIIINFKEIEILYLENLAEPGNRQTDR